MTSRELLKARRKAVLLAWKREQELVRQGMGTRDWTSEQQRQILEEGRACDDNYKPFDGHHMKSVATHPEYADNPDNIQFLTYDEHHNGAHGGDTRIPTNGYYDPQKKVTIDFGDNPPTPCKQIKLSNPIYIMDISSPDMIEGDKSVDRIEQIVREKNKYTIGAKNKRDGTIKKYDGNVLSGISDTIKNVTSKVLDFYVANERLIRPVAEIGLAIIGEVAISKVRGKSKTGKSNIVKTPQSIDIVNVEEKIKRKSPIEHMVSGYTRKNGTYVASYPRGGEKNWE